MKKRNIKAENERVEKDFPKNPDNISKDELHEHFDLNQDGKVTLEEYAEHIDYHCANPGVLQDELDYERGFMYKDGGKVKELKEYLAELLKEYKENYSSLSNYERSEIARLFIENFIEYQHLTKTKIFKKGGLTPAKAKKMLKDGTAQGKPLTDKQRRYFYAVSNEKMKDGGETIKGVSFRQYILKSKDKSKANGLYVYNPYYKRFGYINDENLDKGKIPYRVKVHYNKTSDLGKGTLMNLNDLIIVDERRYKIGGKVRAIGTCYDDSFMMALDAAGENNNNTIIYYGLVRDKYSRDKTEFLHSWVEKDGKIYDSRYSNPIEKEVYYDVNEIIKSKAYTPKEVIKNSLKKSKTGSLWGCSLEERNKIIDLTQKEYMPSKEAYEKVMKKPYEKGGKTPNYDYDYEDIGQFSMKDENWKYFTQEDFRDIGKEITETAFNGDLDVAYESIVKQRSSFEKGGMTKEDYLKKKFDVKEFVDEDTGELVPIEVPIDRDKRVSKSYSPSERRRERKRELKDFQRMEELQDLQGDIDTLKYKLEDEKKYYDSLFVDQDVEAGQKGENWSDDDANRYGVMMNESAEKIAAIKLLIDKKQKEYNEKESSYSEFY